MIHEMRGDTIRKVIRKVKNILAIVFILAICISVGAYLHKCQSPPGDIPGRGECVMDTVTIYDTIPYIEPAPVHSQQIGYKQVKIPTTYINRGVDSLPDIRADTAELASADVDATAPDSLTLQLPITQNVYEGEDYKAYVSGMYPSLDSLFVYPRREIVTIKKPPKRWHIGPTVGFGYTPHGFEPFIGVSITYSIISF